MPNSDFRPVAVDLFAGVGGLSLGFEQAGFDVLAAVEIDPIHCAAHKFNFPHCKVIPQSITKLTGEKIREISPIGKRKVDVVFGGAPCQGFSLIGQRQFDDPRNSLVKDFVRIVHELDAQTFVFENVKGLTVGKHKQFLVELIEEFEKIGYNVQTPWRVLNAASFDVPQNRERLILMGAKFPLPPPHYPEVRTSKPKDEYFDLPLHPTCKEALEDLPDAEEFISLTDSDSVAVNGWKALSSYAAQMRCERSSAWHYGYKRKWNPNELTASLRTDHSEISRRRFRETPPGTVEPISRFYRLTPDGVSNTLRAGSDSARGAFTSPRPIHYKYNRCITVREMARLHGFPDWFRFHETKWHGARQIGNAVPPPLARSVAEQIIRCLSIKPTKPKTKLALGSVELLRMDMSEASKYFDIEVPIGKRDRKSGAKKRKQLQIEIERLAQAEK